MGRLRAWRVSTSRLHRSLQHLAATRSLIQIMRLTIAHHRLEGYYLERSRYWPRSKTGGSFFPLQTSATRLGEASSYPHRPLRVVLSRKAVTASETSFLRHRSLSACPRAKRRPPSAASTSGFSEQARRRARAHYSYRSKRR